MTATACPMPTLPAALLVEAGPDDSRFKFAIGATVFVVGQPQSSAKVVRHWLHIPDRGPACPHLDVIDEEGNVWRVSQLQLLSRPLTERER